MLFLDVQAQASILIITITITINAHWSPSYACVILSAVLTNQNAR